MNLIVECYSVVSDILNHTSAAGEHAVCNNSKVELYSTKCQAIKLWNVMVAKVKIISSVKMIVIRGLESVAVKTEFIYV